MNFLALPPCDALAPFVMGYWFIRDLEGAYGDKPIRTVPHAAAVLTVNFGRPNISEFAARAPRASLLGLQTRPRLWRSEGDCCFVMAMLRPTGLARLFPALGADARDDLIELGAALGDGPAMRLANDLAGAWEPHRVARQLDGWLLDRMAGIRPPAGFDRFADAWRTLAHTGRVRAAAETAAVSPRQLERWFRAHTGLGPKELAGLHRVQASLHAAQTGRGDPMEGFSDQAHMIRSWRRHLGLTPGRYAAIDPSVMASFFAHGGTTDPHEGLAHFL
jgi:AraC-like DNA-binding protein